MGALIILTCTAFETVFRLLCPTKALISLGHRQMRCAISASSAGPGGIVDGIVSALCVHEGKSAKSSEIPDDLGGASSLNQRSLDELWPQTAVAQTSIRSLRRPQTGHSPTVSALLRNIRIAAIHAPWSIFSG